jgi:hypothetical protein
MLRRFRLPKFPEKKANCSQHLRSLRFCDRRCLEALSKFDHPKVAEILAKLV